MMESIKNRLNKRNTSRIALVIYAVLAITVVFFQGVMLVTSPPPGPPKGDTEGENDTGNISPGHETWNDQVLGGIVNPALASGLS